MRKAFGVSQSLQRCSSSESGAGIFTHARGEPRRSPRRPPTVQITVTATELPLALSKQVRPIVGPTVIFHPSLTRARSRTTSQSPGSFTNKLNPGHPQKAPRSSSKKASTRTSATILGHSQLRQRGRSASA